MPNKLLSICIPTYQRKIELESLILSITSQPNVDWNEIEVIISDNHSTDGTKDFLQTLTDNPIFVIKLNEENIGMVPNWKQTIQLAKGEFIWLVGSDDLLVDNTLNDLLLTIKANKTLDLFFLNNFKWMPSEDFKKTYKFHEISNIEKECENEISERVQTISSLIDRRVDAFTAIYTLIMKQNHWRKALDLYNDEVHIFSNAINCFPHTFYIAKNLFHLPGYYYGKPVILASHNVGWVEYEAIYITQYLPEIYKSWIANGAAKKIVREYKNILISWNHSELVPKLLNKKLKGYENFRFYKYLSNFYSSRNFVYILKNITFCYLKIARKKLR